MEKQEKEKKNPFYGSKVSLGIRIVLSLCGITLLIWSFYVPPRGVIDNSVLFAFGEIAIFVSALMWIDYYYLFKGKKYVKHKK
jgi:hypothetical protein